MESVEGYYYYCDVLYGKRQVGKQVPTGKEEITVENLGVVTGRGKLTLLYLLVHRGKRKMMFEAFI